jgi:hypothetical protein
MAFHCELPREAALLKVRDGQLRNKINTLAELTLVMARSCLPSPLKSPTATDWGLVPVPKFVAGLKLPTPSPNYFNNGSWQRISPAGVGDDDPLLPAATL